MYFSFPFQIPSENGDMKLLFGEILHHIDVNLWHKFEPDICGRQLLHAYFAGP